MRPAFEIRAVVEVGPVDRAELHVDVVPDARAAVGLAVEQRIVFGVDRGEVALVRGQRGLRGGDRGAGGGAVLGGVVGVDAGAVRGGELFLGDLDVDPEHVRLARGAGGIGSGTGPGGRIVGPFGLAERGVGGARRGAQAAVPGAVHRLQLAVEHAGLRRGAGVGGQRGVALPLLFPLLAQFGQLALGGGVGAGEVVGAEALPGAVAQDEHQQRVVVHLPRADQLAVRVDGHVDAVERAVHRDIFQPLDPEFQRGVPARAQLARRSVAAQEVGPLGRHVDRVRRRADAAEIGQRLDEAAVAFRGPAVVAVVVARDGGERGEQRAAVFRARLGGGHGEARLVDHRARLAGWGGGAGYASAEPV